MNKKTLILVGSNSIHTHRFVEALSNKLEHLVFITNQSGGLPENVESHIINFRLNNLFAPKQISKILKKYQDTDLVVHIHQANSYAYHTIKAIKKYKISAKIILTTWGSDILMLPHKNLFFNRMVRYNLLGANIITSDSLFMSSKILELVGSQGSNLNLQTINFGMKDLPQHCDLSKKEPLILSNRLHKPLYRIDKIIYGFANLLKDPRFSNYKLVIAGGGSESVKLKHLAQQLGIPEQSILFTGIISYHELKHWYQKAKIFVSIPTSDACSLSLLEAMAFGCIPILSNLPANLEWVIDGVNGIISQNIELIDKDFVSGLNYDDKKYLEIANFNYNLIKNKALFDNNIKEFIQLYGGSPPTRG